jgi:hypothetical protein
MTGEAVQDRGHPYERGSRGGRLAQSRELEGRFQRVQGCKSCAANPIRLETRVQPSKVRKTKLTRSKTTVQGHKFRSPKLTWSETRVQGSKFRWAKPTGLETWVQARKVRLAGVTWHDKRGRHATESGSVTASGALLAHPLPRQERAWLSARLPTAGSGDVAPAPPLPTKGGRGPSFHDLRGRAASPARLATARVDSLRT